MYTIKLNADKSLTTTVKTTLMQKENNVDKIQFLLPQTYLDQDLSDYTVSLIWADVNENIHTEVLERDLETYKDYIRCVFNVTKNFLMQSGDITVWLNLVNLSADEEYQMLRSYSTVVTVSKPSNIVDFADYETLEAMKKKIRDLDKAMPTDLEIDEEDNLHLVHEDEKIGEGVEILMPSQFDELDESNDGIVDVDDVNYEPQDQFIEL